MHLDDDDKLKLTELLLEESALTWVRSAGRIGDPSWQEFGKPEFRLDILATVAHSIRRRLQAESAFPEPEFSYCPRLQGSIITSRGTHLFDHFTHSETQANDGTLVLWDLGDYLRERSAQILDELSTADAIRRLLVELQAIHSLCEGSDELLAHWKRIGLPGGVADWDSYTGEWPGTIGAHPRTSSRSSTSPESVIRTPSVSDPASEPSAVPWDAGTVAHCRLADSRIGSAYIGVIAELL
ncbi:hypothetical protein AURDEDRAFT_159184 [Auricularia subglabra TFB-10046 SS5]|nr:hypothetical protein AURDEDRAFT_159184 [Auricularia subglabra TFB-10046 SS5]